MRGVIYTWLGKPRQPLYLERSGESENAALPPRGRVGHELLQLGYEPAGVKAVAGRMVHLHGQRYQPPTGFVAVAAQREYRR